MTKVNVTLGIDLPSFLLNQINQARSEAFGDLVLTNEDIKDSIVFTVEDQGKLLATGRLFPINGVSFDGRDYSVLGINGIVSLEKGKGYGKAIVMEMMNYLRDHHKTGVGFCIPENRIFYEKCGMGIDTASVRQFVFPLEYGQSSLNDSDIVIYCEGEDKLISKMINNPLEKAFFPCHPW